MNNLKGRCFEGGQYVSLETYKRNGGGIRTPVWFVETGDAVYIRTQESTWKVKRIRNNPAVRLAPCRGNGVLTGDWIAGDASFLLEEENEKILKLFRKKYGILVRIIDFVLSLSRNYAVVVIKVMLHAAGSTHDNENNR